MQTSQPTDASSALCASSSAPGASSSAPEPESAPDASLELSPSLRGRQRKKNPKYLDYQVSEIYDGQTPATNRSRRSTAKVQSHGVTEGEGEGEEVEKEEEVPKKTPKKRGRKPGWKKTSGRPRGVDQGQNGEGVGDEMPKPKRKYTKRKREEEGREQEEETLGAEEEQQEEEETTGARPKRGAARAALKYLQKLAKDLQPNNELPNEVNGDCEAPLRQPAQRAGTPRGPRGLGRKSKRVLNSDAEEDEDFVPNTEDAEEEDAEEALMEEEEEGEMPKERERSTTTRNGFGGQRVNGLPQVTLSSITVSTQITKKFRQECHSSWVFPDWIPSSTDWQLLHLSEVEQYLPEEQQSVLFSVSREGLMKEEPQRLPRFSSLPSHFKRWDSVFFCGGPVWSLEWCPTPEHSTTDQYLALSCHRTMDEQHQVSQVYSGPGLVQIWGLGNLKYDQRPESQPALVYSLAQDRGFIWGLKWCPAGAWEPPHTDRQAPLVPRLGLLAVASSLGLVTVYSLPHPQALISSHQTGKEFTLYKLSINVYYYLDFTHYTAWGWSDSEGPVTQVRGHVGVWDLLTRSSLLRVREADGSMTLLPFECFLAHDHPVRHVSFYPASRSLLVTAGEDRFIKTWDLLRLFEPVTQQKRNLNTEICWPLFAPGLLVSEEVAYAA
ncbi:hypothetical protein NQD34_017548 [Periophthalmus magnuspinnatus]|nr:hypothetical protein NQD34_017548 [Periophthalmus magnuspinnatus]